MQVALVAASCLFGCGGGGTIASPQLPSATADDAAYWADQLRPRDDANAALEAEAAQRYLDSVPEPTRVRWEAETHNPAFNTCLQLLHVGSTLQRLGQFENAAHEYDLVLARTDCPFGRTFVARRSAMARHGARVEEPPSDPAQLAKVADDLVAYEHSLPPDEGSWELFYEIAVLQTWAQKPDPERLRRLLTEVEDELAVGDVTLTAQTSIHIAYLGGQKLDDADLLNRSRRCDEEFRQLTGQSAIQ